MQKLNEFEFGMCFGRALEFINLNYTSIPADKKDGIKITIQETCKVYMESLLELKEQVSEMLTTKQEQQKQALFKPMAESSGTEGDKVASKENVQSKPANEVKQSFAGVKVDKPKFVF